MAAIQIDNNGDIFYILPGGDPEPEELLADAVIRECAEELGVIVSVQELVFVIEGMHREPFHRVDLVFLCQYQSDVPNPQTQCDANQTGVEWLLIDDLEIKPLYPLKLRKQIKILYHSLPHDTYLENENMDL